jgi:hypothetical protein
MKLPRKRSRVGFAVLATLVAWAPVAGDEAPLGVEVEFVPAEATVGDPIEATLTLALPSELARARVRFPDWSEGRWGAVEVLTASPAERVEEGGVTVWRQRLRLAAFRAGNLPLPPVTAGIESAPPHAARTPDDLVLSIRSVLPASAEEGVAPEPMPEAGPRPFPLPVAFHWTVAALALAAAALAWALRRRAAGVGAVAGPVPPLVELDGALATLGDAAPEAGHAALSHALRRFLGRSFGIPALESTTRELAQRLDRRGLARDLVRRTLELLRAADGVKFARRPATSEELARRSAEARAVAAAIDAHLRPPDPAEAAFPEAAA